MSYNTQELHPKSKKQSSIFVMLILLIIVGCSGEKKEKAAEGEAKAQKEMKQQGNHYI